MHRKSAGHEAEAVHFGKASMHPTCYVPNVVYTCGGLIVADETLVLPYGISDSAIGFARVPLQRIFDEVLV